MKKKCISAQCCDTRGNAFYGGLVGIGFASLHHVHHALTKQIPDSILAHVLSELAAAAFGGTILFAIGSAICNRIKGTT